MAPPNLKDEYQRLYLDLMSTMEAGVKRRYNLNYPASSSDWQACIEPLFLLYDIQRRHIPLERKDLYAKNAE